MRAFPFGRGSEGCFDPAISRIRATDIISASLVQKSGINLVMALRIDSCRATVLSLVAAAQANNGLKNNLGYARETMSKKLDRLTQGATGGSTTIRYHNDE